MEQIIKDLKNKSVDKIKKLLEENNNEITGNNLEPIGKLLDIHKDIANIEYWKEKEESNMYGNYNGREQYGNYREYNGYRNYGNGSYNARGYDMKYRGNHEIERISDEYGRYMENRERYGTGEETDRSFHYMVKALEDFIKVLHEEAETPQQKQQLRESLQRSMM